MRFFALASLCLFSALVGLLGIVPVASADEPLCVVKTGVNLRKGPSDKHRVSWAVPKFMPLQKIEKKGNWYKVRDLEGHVHWVASRGVSTKTSCLVVKSKTAKLRTGPGKDKALAELESVDRYTPFKKVDRDGEWVQVKDVYNGIYWIHESNVWIPMARTQVTF